jgi:excisionase family DNA binding protein
VAEHPLEAARVTRRGRRRATPIADIDRETREYVGLQVAARCLGLSDEAIKARVQDGRLDGWRDGRVWRISTKSLRRHIARRRAMLGEFG